MITFNVNWVMLDGNFCRICYKVKASLLLAGQILKVKGAAPLCNLSVWEPRFGGFTWGVGAGWYHQGPVKGPR